MRRPGAPAGGGALSRRPAPVELAGSAAETLHPFPPPAMLSLPLLLAVLVALPGILIPLLVSSRMLRVLSEGGRGTMERVFAVGTLALMGLAAYAATAIFASVGALSAAARP